MCPARVNGSRHGGHVHPSPYQTLACLVDAADGLTLAWRIVLCHSAGRRSDRFQSCHCAGLRSGAQRRRANRACSTRAGKTTKWPASYLRCRKSGYLVTTSPAPPKIRRNRPYVRVRIALTSPRLAVISPFPVQQSDCASCRLRSARQMLETHL